MSSLSEFFEDKEKILNVIQDVTIGLKDPNLSYEEWKTQGLEGTPKGKFRNPKTGIIVNRKKMKILYDQHIKGIKKKEVSNALKEQVLKEDYPMYKCHDCGEEYPRVKEHNGQKLNFWPNNPSTKNGMRNFCGSWGKIHYVPIDETGKDLPNLLVQANGSIIRKNDGLYKIVLGCDTYRDRLRYTTEENPYGVRKGYEGDYSERTKHPHKILSELVSSCRTKYDDCDLPQDWAINQAEQQNYMCAGFAKVGKKVKFDMTKTKGEKNLLNPSIDRIDNSKGHVVGNCQLTTYGFNMMTNNAPDHNIMALLEQLQ